MLTNDLAKALKALADPTRLRMIGMMVAEPRCGQELASDLGLAAATVSHHLRLLKKAGLLRESRQSPYTFYQLDHSALQALVRPLADKAKVQNLAAGPGLSDERRRVLNNFFDGDTLTQIPSQRRKKEIVFEELLRRLPPREEYTERELSEMIEAFHPDFCTIRREFIMGRYMTRSGGRYRLAPRGQAVVDDAAETAH